MNPVLLFRSLLSLATLWGGCAVVGAQGLAPLGNIPQSPSNPFGLATSPGHATPAQAPDMPAALPAPVYWGQSVFVIPYQWSSRSDAASATEVVLYVSIDQGRSWNEVTRARADVRSFLYRAQRDGEYWFSVRTIDDSGRMWPTGGHAPELGVIVDTQIPQLRLAEASLDLSGRLQVRCELLDANPNAATMQLAVIHQGASNWTPLPVSLRPGHLAEGFTGDVQWQAPSGVSQVTLRAAAQDMAGNPAGAGMIVNAKASATDPLSAPAISVAAPLGDQTASGDPFLNAPQLSLPTGSAPVPPAADLSVDRTPEPTAWPADETASKPFRASDPGSWRSATSPSRNTVVAAKPKNPAQPITQRAASQPSPTSPFHHASASRGSAQLPNNPGVDPFLQRDQPRRGVAASSALPDDVLHVNATRFALDYNLESVGQWGVSRVEVWGSLDHGETWRQFAVDSDNRSPVDLQVDGPGLYGFRILVQGVGGLPVVRPRPGDLPEVQVSVDLEQPVTRITAAAQGEGYFADHLIINWQVDDAQLESRSIKLLYSNRPNGPWQPVAANLENTGKYAWRLQRHLPGALYVRLEARDRAGNVGADQTQQPILISLPEPTGRIQSVRPLGR